MLDDWATIAASAFKARRTRNLSVSYGFLTDTLCLGQRGDPVQQIGQLIEAWVSGIALGIVVVIVITVVMFWLWKG